jgi:hypothetical protein
VRLLGPINSSNSPLTAYNYNVMLGRCQTHYTIIDGVPEVHFYGGRFGFNGTGNLNANDFAYFTLTKTVGSGGGPNTVTYDGVHMNPGDGGVACAFRWGGFTGSGGTQQQFQIVNSPDIEYGYSGSYPSTGVFCSDSTVSSIRQLWFENNVVDNKVMAPLFNINSATVPKFWHIDGNAFNCSGTRLALPSGMTAFEPLYLNGAVMFTGHETRLESSI